MQCQHARGLMQDRLDGTPPSCEDAAALDDHVRACGGCARFQAGMALLARGAALLAVPPVSPELTHTLVDALRARYRRDVRRRQWRWAGSFAAAASVLVALGLGLRYWPAPVPVPPDPPPVVVVPPAPPPEPGNLRDTVSEAGSAVAALTSRTADSTVGSSRLLLPAVVGPMVPEVDLMSPAEPTGRHLADAGEGVREGFQPLADSARRAFNLFVRDLPAVDAPPGPDS